MMLIDNFTFWLTAVCFDWQVSTPESGQLDIEEFLKQPVKVSYIFIWFYNMCIMLNNSLS